MWQASSPATARRNSSPNWRLEHRQTHRDQASIHPLRQKHRRPAAALRGARESQGVLEVWTRRIVQWNTTERPTADWTAQAPQANAFCERLAGDNPPRMLRLPNSSQ